MTKLSCFNQNNPISQYSTLYRTAYGREQVRRHFIGRHLIARQLNGDSSPSDIEPERQLNAAIDNQLPLNRRHFTVVYVFHTE